MILIESSRGDLCELRDRLRVDGPDEDGLYVIYVGGYNILDMSKDGELMAARMARLATYLEDLKVIRPITIVRYCSYE